jgi:hypothetical protein
MGLMYKPSPDDLYKMTSSPKGLFVIINMQTFDQGTELENRAGSELENRAGSELDVESLQWLFKKKIDFEIETLRDMNKEELLSKLKNISRSPDLEKHDCFALCVMSHGGEDFFYTSDGEKIKVADIRDMFKNSSCESLKGKPKLFFIQACRGKLIDRGVVVSDNPHTEEDTETTSSEPQTNSSVPKMPEFADILIAYSSFDGHKSYRTDKQGSFFIQFLVGVFGQYAYIEDVLHMLTRVNDKVSELRGKYGAKQIPTTVNTLRKLVFFNPKGKF